MRHIFKSKCIHDLMIVVFLLRYAQQKT